jgi:RHS repeat-associated protein
LQDTSPIQNLDYEYDPIGNVKDKQDHVLNVQDNYQYDDLNRLTQDQTVDNAHGGQTTNLNYAYDDLGNIKTKSDVGNYTYAQNNAGPHAVTSIGGGSETDQFQYDANGNQTQAVMNTANGTITRNISYTSFDVPKTITQTNDKAQTSSTVNFYYNADRKRFMRQDQVTAPDPTTHQLVTTKTTTLYLDGMEIDTTTDATGKITNTFKNYIGDAELILDDQGNRTTYDILKDNIGSTSVITDQSGNVVQRFHYDPFGEQQLVDTTTQSSPRPRAGEGPGVRANTTVTIPHNTSKAGDIDPQDRTSITRYGFTGQEEVNAGGIDLIHMNGRMYDPHLGRFLSADPVIQDPSNSQCLNRYSYCNNNPIAAVDPSGFSWFGDLWHSIEDTFKSIFHGIGQILRNPVVGQIMEIAVAAIAITTLGPAGIAVSAAFNAAVSYTQTGSIGFALKTAAFTALSEYAWIETGNLLQSQMEYPGQNWEGDHWAVSSLVHGEVGGALNVIEGGSFKNGFLSAAASQALSGPISKIPTTGDSWGTYMSRGLAAGVVGGTVAAATGGNFENGMMTSAFGEIFNACFHEQWQQISTACNADPRGCAATFGIAVVGGATGFAATTSFLTIDAAVSSESLLQEGTTVYRIWGGDSTAWGESWTRVNPMTVANYRNLAGLPSWNTGAYLSEGVLNDTTGITVREALAFHGNDGGLDELVIQNAANKIDLKSITRLYPNF